MAAVILSVLAFFGLLLLLVFKFTCNHKWRAESQFERVDGRKRFLVKTLVCEKCGEIKQQEFKL